MKSKKFVPFVPYQFTRIEDISWFILGLLVCIIGAGIPYFIISGYFIMHDEFINRWRLLRRLRNGPSPLFIEKVYGRNMIDNAFIYSIDEKYTLIVDNMKISLHYASNQDCIVCTHVPHSVLDRYLYNSIIKECQKLRCGGF